MYDILVLVAFVGALVALFFALFKKGKRLKGVGGLIVCLFVMAYAAGKALDNQALEAGFKSYEDRKAAEEAGIADPEEYEKHLAAVAAEREAEREAREAKEREAKRAAEEAELAAAEAKRAEAEAEAEACRQDLKCWGDEHWGLATVYCTEAVESLAKWDFEWTDSWTEVKFGRYRWKDQKAGVVSYLGDKIKMQNGFGAWRHVTYRCDYDPKIEMVVDAYVYE